MCTPQFQQMMQNPQTMQQLAPMQAQIGQLLQKGAANSVQSSLSGNVPTGGPAVTQGLIKSVPPVGAGQTNTAPNGMPQVSGGPPQIAAMAAGNPNPGGGQPGAASGLPMQPPPGAPAPGGMPMPHPMADLVHGKTAGGLPGGVGRPIPGAPPIMPKMNGAGNVPGHSGKPAPAPGAIARLVGGHGLPQGRGMIKTR